MILVDTNIIIDFWDKPTAQAEKIFAEHDIAICGVIKTELLRGSRSDSDFSQIETALSDFTYLRFAESDWRSLAQLFITFRQHGLVVPFQDAMIVCLALKYDCEIWTNDKHFTLMKSILPELRLFAENGVSAK